MNLSRLFLVAVLSCSRCVEASTSQAQFGGIGDLTGGIYSSKAADISADGSTIVGASEATDGLRAFTWNVGTGMVSLPGVGGGPDTASASGASSTGAYSCGFGLISTGIIRAARWFAQGTPVQIGTLNSSGYRFSQAAGVSSDGSRVVGISSSASGTRAFLWTATSPSAGTLSDLGFIFPTTSTTGDFSINSDAKAISADGTKVVGNSSYIISETVTIPASLEIFYKRDENGDLIYPLEEIGRIYTPAYDQVNTLEEGRQAFLWSEGGSGMVGLEVLPGGELFSDALAISTNGSVIAGACATDSGIEATIWNDGTIESIGDLPGGAVDARALDLTSDGSIVVGVGTDSQGLAAMIWSREFGIGNLNSILEAQGVSLNGWRLTEATAISDDGQVIVGNGINPNGDPEGWRISNALTLLNILIPPPDGLQESMRVVCGKVAQFTAERGRSYQLLRSTDLASWSSLGSPFDTSNAGSSFEHALPLPPGSIPQHYLLGPSSNPAEADTSITIVEGTMIQYSSERGYTYRPEYSDDLLTWTPLGETIDTSSDQGPVDRVFIDTTAALNHPQRFYRIQTAPTEFLTTPYDLIVGDFIVATAEPGQDYQIRRSTEFDSGSGQWVNFSDYGPLLTAGGSTTPITWYVFITPRTFPASDSYLGVSIPQEVTQSSGFFSGGEGAVVRFTSQPGFIYQVQASADGSLFTNLGSPINTATSTGPAEQMVIDSYDTAGPAPHIAYRVIETPVE